MGVSAWPEQAVCPLGAPGNGADVSEETALGTVAPAGTLRLISSRAHLYVLWGPQ